MYDERGLSQDTSWWQYFNPLNCGNGAKFEHHYNTCFCYMYQILKFPRNQLWTCLVIVWLFIKHFPNQTEIRKMLALKKQNPEWPERNFLESRWFPTTNLMLALRPFLWDSNPGQTVGRWVLLPLWYSILLKDDFLYDHTTGINTNRY